LVFKGALIITFEEINLAFFIVDTIHKLLSYRNRLKRFIVFIEQEQKRLFV